LKNFLINVFIFLLVFVGILLISLPFFESRLVYHQTNMNISIDPEVFEENLEAEAEFDFAAISSIDLPVILGALTEEVSPIGEILIPSVNIHLPILRGTTDATMSLGAGTMRPEQMMGEGNYPLASHRMNDPAMLFTPLQYAEIGERIFLRDANYIYIYEISEWQIISQYDVSVIDDIEGETLITLITCTEANDDYRIMVRGEFDEAVPIESLMEAETAEIEDSDLLEIFDIIDQQGERSEPGMTWLVLEIGGIVVGAALAGFLAVFFSSRRNKKKNDQNLTTKISNE